VIVGVALLLLLGTLLGVQVAMVLLVVVILGEVVHLIWMRYGLQSVVYERRLERDRVTWGEAIAATITIWNRKRLPVAWLRAEDATSPLVTVRERRIAGDGLGGRALRNAWTLAPFERVTRHFHVTAERRGVYELGPVDLSVGDLFAREAASERRELVGRFLVRPRTVETSPLVRRDLSGGLERSRTGLTEDPSRFAGIREYAPGDSLRRVHPRASARLGRPVVKRFEPSRDREVIVALDVRLTAVEAWGTPPDASAVESLFVVAASLARSLGLERVPFGVATAGFQGGGYRIAWLPVAEGPAQAARAFDLLARAASDPLAPFSDVVRWVARFAKAGSTVVVVTGRDPTTYVADLHRLERSGCQTLILACGPDGVEDAARARGAGLAARSARLDGPWQTAGHLVMGR
jgi:uncharacterized protein (DUF58 family)